VTGFGEMGEEHGDGVLQLVQWPLALVNSNLTLVSCPRMCVSSPTTLRKIAQVSTK